MATAKVKQPLVPRTNRGQEKDVAQLAAQFASGLKISNAPQGDGARPRKGTVSKHRSTKKVEESAEESRAAAMRSVNSVLQSLSSAVQSDWKATAARKGSVHTVSGISVQASTAQSSLNLLRKLRPGDLDIERAALSASGKLISLEMFDSSLDMLLDINSHLKSFYRSQDCSSTSATAGHPLPALQLSLPAEFPIDASIQTQISNYFAQAHTVVSTVVSSKPQLHSAFIDALGASGSFPSWIPYLTDLPTKSIDFILKRTYMTITSTFGPPQASPLIVLRLRFRALRVLLLTSEVSSTSFWEQCLKFAAAYAKAEGAETEQERSETMKQCFTDIVRSVEGREDRSIFMSGKLWITVCEYWMSLAKRAGDLLLLGRIMKYIQQAASTSSPNQAVGEKMTTPANATSVEPQSPKDEFMYLSSRVCATFTQTVAMFENHEAPGDSMALVDNTLLASIEGSMSCCRELSDFMKLHSSLIVENKLRRALEKLRRCSIKVVGTEARETVLKGATRSLCESIVDALDTILKASQCSRQDDSDYAISALDTLFNLASATLVPQRQSTCDEAYDFLNRASHIIEIYSNITSDDSQQQNWAKRTTANFQRCLSGAFFNVAGTLYKAEAHGTAIRFLLQGCPLAVRALKLYESTLIPDVAKGKVRDTQDPEQDKDLEAWKTHKAQIYKRWELLAICYTKTGDRKLAHEAFLKGVSCYSFDDTMLASASAHATTSTDGLFFGTSKQVGAMIDKLTYIAAAELFLREDVSLLQPLREAGVPELVIGLVLVRQIRSLDESKWKPEIKEVIGLLLADLLSIYASTFPVRRAQTLIWQLEHIYYTQGDGFIYKAREIVEEIGILLSSQSEVGDDRNFETLRPYLRVTAGLWLILHLHRSQETLATLLRHVNDVIDSLNALIAKNFPKQPEQKIAPPNVKQAKTAIIRSASTRSKASTTVRRIGSNKALQRPPVTPRPLKNSEMDRLDIEQSINDPPVDLFSVEYKTLMERLLMVSELLGMLGLVLPKLQLLHLARRVAETSKDTSSEIYMQISTALAHELSRIGKMENSLSLFRSLYTLHKCQKHCNIAGVRLLLRYAETLATSGSLSQSLSIYEEAWQLHHVIETEDTGLSTSVRIRRRVVGLEMVAMASAVFAAIQAAKNELPTSLKALLQALRLLNKATDLLSRLSPLQKRESPLEDSDPFAMPRLENAVPVVIGTGGKSAKLSSSAHNVFQDGLEWRIANTLLETMLLLSRVYCTRGSAREAEYFTEQAEELAKVIQSPILASRSLLRRADIQLSLRRTEDSRQTLDQAWRLIQDIDAPDMIDARRLKGDLLQKLEEIAQAQKEYSETYRNLIASAASFNSFDHILTGCNASSGSSVLAQSAKNTFLPDLCASVLKRCVWIQRDEDYEQLLEKLLALPQTSEIQVQTNSLLGKLALYNIHARFRSDISLNSLAESIIALPMGMTCERFTSGSSPQEIVEALEQADDLLSMGLKDYAGRASVVEVRSSAVAAALLNIYQASLGRASQGSPALAARLLDMSSAITLSRELIEAVQFKFSDIDGRDDTEWPSESSSTRKPHPASRPRKQGRGLFERILDDDDAGELTDDAGMRKYWDYVLERHRAQDFIPDSQPTSDINSFPENWVVMTLTLTEDKTTLLVSRQRPKREPIIFCVPLRGRREGDDGEHFNFEDAMTEMESIIHSSDEGTKQASQISPDDKEGKAAWWAERKRLDHRLKELVENIEFCWLGAFKTILGQPARIPPDIVVSLRVRLEKVFRSVLGSYEKRSQKAKLSLDTGFIELFSTLSPTCRDEELEDMIYFVLDLYHFHGLPIALAEVDIDVVTVDLRAALEEHHARTAGRVISEPDAHMFLVLDKNLQSIPWESLPILRGRSVSRVPSIAFLCDRLALARFQQGLPLAVDESDEEGKKVNRALVDPSNTYFLLNPSGDLSGTEKRFKDLVNDMKRTGWDGLVGQSPSEQQFLNALSRKDLVVYFGHGGAEQYVRSHKIRHLQRCAATMLWGCSSGALRDLGDFDRIGTPNNYMLAGCPTLVANLWDVTDRDIDKFAQAVFERLSLNPTEVGKWQKGRKKLAGGKTSIVAAVAQSRDACKLKYLTGAAVVVYGIPFYL